MATTLKGAITKVVIYRGDEPALTIDVDAGNELQGLVFDRGMADKCPAPHGKWPPPGLHFHGGKATLLTADATAATADTALATPSALTAHVMAAPPPPPPPPDPPPGCYLVDNVVYCP
jgi:hypothetical protein